MSHAVCRFMVLVFASSVTIGCSGGSTAVLDASGSDTAMTFDTGTTSACDPSDMDSCGGASGDRVCVAHSLGDVSACEHVGEPPAGSPDPGCAACRTDADCTTTAGCAQGSCRQRTGYDFVKPASVQVDDAFLGMRCCASGHVMCTAGSNGGENCTCTS